MRARRVLACAAILLWTPIAQSAVAAETKVEVHRNGESFDINAVSAVTASQALVWHVLTDYESYPAFVPNLSLSRIVNLQPLRIEQRGSFGILFFRKEIDVTLEVDERPRSMILFRSLAGDFRLLETEVAVERADTGALIRYRSKIIPDFWVPPLITAPLIRRSVFSKLHAVSLEIERRAVPVLHK